MLIFNQGLVTRDWWRILSLEKNMYCRFYWFLKKVSASKCKSIVDSTGLSEKLFVKCLGCKHVLSSLVERTMYFAELISKTKKKLAGWKENRSSGAKLNAWVKWYDCCYPIIERSPETRKLQDMLKSYNRRLWWFINSSSPLLANYTKSPNCRQKDWWSSGMTSGLGIVHLLIMLSPLSSWPHS